MNRKVLIAGAHGVIGRAAAIRLASQPDAEVFGLSRRIGTPIAGLKTVSVDQLDPEQVKDRLSAIREVTHIVFAAYIEKQKAAEKSEFNVAILRNLPDAVEATSPKLQHVTFYQGGKAYGADLATAAQQGHPRDRLTTPPISQET